MYNVYIVGGDKMSVAEMVDGVPWRAYGFTVVGTGVDPEHAANEITELSPHVVIFDRENPDLYPHEFMRRISAANGDCKFIMLAASYNFKSMRFFFRRGGHDYLLKPFRGQEAGGYLRELSGRLFSETVCRTDYSIAQTTLPMPEGY